MTIAALPEGDARIARLMVRAGRVTFLARNLQVKSRQGKPGFGVIELLGADRLPVRGVMALGAIRAQASLVRVLMAAGAGWRESQECAVQVLHFDGAARRSWNFRRRVALRASQAGMFSFKSKASLGVIESLGLPLDEGKVLTVVVGVAGWTSLA